MTQYWGGTRHFFLLTLCNFKKIGGGDRATPRSLFVHLDVYICELGLYLYISM